MIQPKSRNVIIFAVGLAFLAVAVFFALFSSGDDILSPYVPFKEAQASSGRYVQVIGALDKSVPVKHSEGAFTFTLVDGDGTKMNVIHRGTKPQNFEHTEQVVLLGRFSIGSSLFEADKVLVKCPSKYRREQ